MWALSLVSGVEGTGLFQIEAYFGDIPDGNLQELEMNLSEVPAGPMKYRYPADGAIELLRQRYDCHAPNQEGCQ
jgi:hypothetical protein